MYAADRDLAILQRLAQHLQCVAGKLRQLIQEQHTVVGQTDLAGAGTDPPPTMAVELTLWCGLRNGRSRISPAPPRKSPATE